MEKGPYFTTSDGYPLCRITVRVDGRRRRYWARRLGVRTQGAVLRYQEVGRDGDPVFDGGRRDGADVTQIRIILAAPEDVIEELPARMNAHYGELELDPTRTSLE
jgi:hypothetical protein